MKSAVKIAKAVETKHSSEIGKAMPPTSFTAYAINSPPSPNTAEGHDNRFPETAHNGRPVKPAATHWWQRLIKH